MGLRMFLLKSKINQFLLASLDESSGFTMFEYDHRRGLWTIRKDNHGIQCTQPTVLLDVIF
jgi:hypothetical protein